MSNFIVCANEKNRFCDLSYTLLFLSLEAFRNLRFIPAKRRGLKRLTFGLIILDTKRILDIFNQTEHQQAQQPVINHRLEGLLFNSRSSVVDSLNQQLPSAALSFLSRSFPS